MAPAVGGVIGKMRILQSYTSELNKLYVFELEDTKRVEAVFYRGDTLCVSSQVGCAVGCPFCASGRYGLLRNLTYQEIYGQYELLKEFHTIKRIAVAGIGEPLMNFGEVYRAFWLFKRDHLKVSFYTTGYPVSRLEKLLSLPHNGVTISLHSVDEDKHRLLLPHAGRLQDLIRELQRLIPSMPLRKRKKISLAYLLIEDVNDSPEEITSFGKLVKELSLSATLLYYNDTGSGFKPVDTKAYEEAFLLLRSMGVRVTLSTRFRKDRLGGCGTLTVSRS